MTVADNHFSRKIAKLMTEPEYAGMPEEEVRIRFLSKLGYKAVKGVQVFGVEIDPVTWDVKKDRLIEETVASIMEDGAPQRKLTIRNRE